MSQPRQTENAVDSSTSAENTSVKQEGPERNASIDSQAFFEDGDDYDDYDDFGAAGGKGGGGGSKNNTTNQRVDKRQKERGGSGGSGNVYSAKHIRMKEAQNSKAKPPK